MVKTGGRVQEHSFLCRMAMNPLTVLMYTGRRQTIQTTTTKRSRTKQISTGFAGMGNLLKVLTREIENCPHFFLDFENAQPTECEKGVWNQVNAVLQDSENVLTGLQAYKGAVQEIRELDIEHEVNNEMANRMSLFYAEATPMLKTLSNATTAFVSELWDTPSPCHTVQHSPKAKHNTKTLFLLYHHSSSSCFVLLLPTLALEWWWLTPFIAYPEAFQVLDHLVLIALPGGTEDSPSRVVDSMQLPLAAIPAPNQAVEDSISHGARQEAGKSPSARDAATKSPGVGIQLSMFAPPEHMQQGHPGPAWDPAVHHTG
ncbi:FA49A protein, partial [Polypterus senegalus]